MKEKTVYVCTVCGCRSSKWSGKCTDCGSWNSFEEIKETAKKPAGAVQIKSNVNLFDGNGSAVRFSGNICFSIISASRSET